MTFQDKLDDITEATRNKTVKEESIKRLKGNISMLKKFEISAEQIRSEMLQEYSDVLTSPMSCSDRPERHVCRYYT